MKRILLMDIDNTLLDFDKAQDYALTQVLVKYGLPLDEDVKRKYHIINLSYWKKLERGEITKEELVLKRFDDFFGLFDMVINAQEVYDLYFTNLCQAGYYLKNAQEFLMKATAMGLQVVAISNGVKQIQESRMTKVGIQKYFTKIYLSDDVGYNKPDIRFFEAIENDYPNQKEDMLLIGDSLTSDIQGGLNYGVDTVWFNLKNETPSPLPKYTITDLMEIFDLIN